MIFLRLCLQIQFVPNYQMLFLNSMINPKGFLVLTLILSKIFACVKAQPRPSFYVYFLYVKAKFRFSTFSIQIWSFYLQIQLTDRFQSHIVGFVMFSSNVLQFAKEHKYEKGANHIIRDIFWYFSGPPPHVKF